MKAVLEPGNCCATCLPEHGMCTEGDKSYFNGQIWNVSRCAFRTCMDGQISAYTAQCTLSQCAQVRFVQITK